MTAPRSAAAPPEVIPTLLCSNFVTQNREILMTEFAPNKLLKISREMEPPNKLLKIKSSNEKDVKNEGTSQ